MVDGCMGLEDWRAASVPYILDDVMISVIMNEVLQSRSSTAPASERLVVYDHKLMNSIICVQSAFNMEMF